MLGNKKTVPLWRRKRPNFLKLGRALGAIAGIERHSDLQYAVISQKTERRRAVVARQRFVRPADLR